MVSPTVAEVLRQFLPAYRQRHTLSPQQAKVARHIVSCRTEALGGYTLACAGCSYRTEMYHSCRDRHCPQCQQQATDEWLAKRRADLLPVPYYHVVFTLPHSLNGWLQLHPEVFYRLLFQNVWHTLRAFGRDPKRLGGELGMTAVLHTWGQNLSQHVHLHCLVPGGALDPEGPCWHPARSSYLFPVRALSRHFRGAMVAALRHAWTAGQLHRIRDHREVDQRLAELMKTSWVVYTRGTGKHTEKVLAYLARYTHRIAISDRRLIAVDPSGVTFAYSDYARGGERRTLHLAGEEFIRRMLMHVLPHGFMRVRHYGFLANCQRREKLRTIRRCLCESAEQPTTAANNETVPGAKPRYRCPCCRHGLLYPAGKIPPAGRRRTQG